STNSTAEHVSVSGLGGHNDIDSTVAPTPSSLSLSRTSGRFGFSADYMARLEWLVGNISGFGITGFESNGADIPKTGSTAFNGRGGGFHSVSFRQYFDVTINVDFTGKNATLITRNTCVTFLINSCGDGSSFLRPQFDFTGEGNYSANSNQLIFESVTTKGDDLDFNATDGTELSGTANAKFYGPATDELGGTFNLSNADSTIGYVGFFGGQKGYIISDEIQTETTHADTPTTFNADNLTGFNDDARFNNGTPNDTSDDAGKTDVTLPVASIVQITKNSTDNTIANESISGGVTQFDYENNGNFKGAGFTLYFADKKYETLTGSLGDANRIDGYALDIDADNILNSSTLSYLYKNEANFGFVPNYMAALSWNVWPTDDNTYGYGMTGFATLGTAIPTNLADNATFTGEGQGQYHDKNSAIGSTSNLRYFIISANVDFNTREVVLTSSETCSIGINNVTNTCSISGNKRDHLNFTGTLKYDSADNNLTGTLTSAGDDDNAQLSGTADARFYGPAAEELGGTFSMTSHEAGYVGYFGVAK
ncbi:MAG: transferrin-binding protein-like solute binding protein, partial [Alphaproteobacteria bacterium]|nr:transferrin-binding protein-like solute binding protein [Alphaproteobacteria bacterium]